MPTKALFLAARAPVDLVLTREDVVSLEVPFAGLKGPFLGKREPSFCQEVLELA